MQQPSTVTSAGGTNSSTSPAHWRRRVAIAFAAATLALFVMLNLAFVAKRGVCCADDALIATVAKNLAWGFGYSATLDFTLRPFDANITTGPTLVLPVSAAIRLFGNRFWLPGAVHVMLWTILVVAAWGALGAVGSRGRAAIVSALFLLVVYAMSPYHLEQWYAMLGEVPAALAILVGVALWAVNPRSGRRSLMAGVLCSLAVLTKMLALVYVAAFFAGAVAVALTGQRDPRHRGKVLGPILLGFLLPILAFEVWKAASLGPESYLANLRAFGQYVSSYGTSRAAFSPAEIINRLNVFSTRFGVSLPVLLLLAVGGGSLAWRAGSPAFRRLYLVLLVGVTLHAGYWLAWSPGWPRYFFSGVILLSALVTLPYLVLARPLPIMLYSVALALSLLGTVGRLPGPVASVADTWFAPSASRSSQESVVRFLDARRDRRPFVGQWWAPVADLEYLSNGVRDFKPYTALTRADLVRGVLVVTNSRFDNAEDKRFSSFVASCGQPILASAPYSIYECGGPKASSWVPVTAAGEMASPVLPTPAIPPDIRGSGWVAASHCNVEHVGHRLGGPLPVTLRRGEVLHLDGWVVDEHAQRVPTRPYVAFQSINTRATWYAAFAAGLPRADVAQVMRHEAYRSSGFSVYIDTFPLPPAEYRLFLLFRDFGPAFVCDNGRRLLIR